MGPVKPYGNKDRCMIICEHFATGLTVITYHISGYNLNGRKMELLSM